MTLFLLQATSTLLNEAASLLSVSSRGASTFNTSSLLIRREADLSHVFAWMLNPRGNHGEGHTFLSEFLDLAGVPGVENPAASRVRLEVPLLAAKASVGRVDIEVSHPEFILLLENKPTAALGHRQLERYMSSLPTGLLRQGKVILLSGTAFDFDQLRRIAEMGVVVLRLAEEVVDWVCRCHSLTKTTSVKLFLADLRDDLEKRYSGQEPLSMRELVDLMIETPDAVAAAIAIAEASGDLATRMTQRFASQVDNRAKAAAVGSVRSRAGDGSLFINKFGTLRLDIGDPRFDFVLQADEPNFKRVAVGVCTPDKTDDLAEQYVVEIAKLNQLMGAGADEPGPNFHWLWCDFVESLDLSGGRTDSKSARWKWAADQSDDGLAACFVRRAADAKAALGL